jgi:hypothetical protein
MNKSTKLLLVGLATGAAVYFYKELVKNKKSENKEDNTDKYEYYKAFNGDVSLTSPSYVSFENMETKIAPLASKKDLEEMRGDLESDLSYTQMHIVKVEKDLEDTLARVCYLEGLIAQKIGRNKV